MAKKLKWGRGFYRLWVVASAFWIAIIVLFFHSLWQSGSLHSPPKRTIEISLKANMLTSRIAPYERRRITCEDFPPELLQDPWCKEETSRSLMKSDIINDIREDVEYKYEKKIASDPRLEFEKQKWLDLVAKEWREVIVSRALVFILLAIFPPAFFLLLGLTVRWIMKGFATVPH